MSRNLAGLPGLLVRSCLGMAIGVAAAVAAPTAADVDKAYGDLMRAKHKLTSESDQFSAADATQFRAGLEDAVSVYSRPGADEKELETALSYMFAYCEQPPADDVTRCRQLKKQGHALVLSRLVDSNNVFGFVLDSTQADLAFVDEVFDKTHSSRKNAVAEAAGELWLKRYNDEKITPQERQIARQRVLKYGHFLEQDNTVSEWEGKSMAMSHLKGEGLVNGVEVESKGKVMPDFSWQSFAGDKVSLQQYRGKVVLLDFWATWCVPCVASMPHINELRQELVGKPLEVISINSEGGDVNKVIAFQSKKVSMPWTNWLVPTQSEDYFRIGLTALPTYFVLDANGKVLYRSNQFDEQVKAHVRTAVAALSKG